MNTPKNWIKVGSTVGAVGVVILIYNLFKGYDIAGKCPPNIQIQLCHNYTNWVTLNKLGLAVVVVGAMILLAGLIKRSEHKR